MSKNVSQALQETLQDIFAHFRASFDVACNLSSQGVETRVIVSLQYVLFFVQGLKEQCSAETMNVQDFTNSVHEATSR
jgi:hypothetical protein